MRPEMHPTANVLGEHLQRSPGVILEYTCCIVLHHIDDGGTLTFARAGTAYPASARQRAPFGIQGVWRDGVVAFGAGERGHVNSF